MTNNKEEGLMKRLSRFALQVLIALCIGLSLNSYIFAFPGVVGPSMEKTLHDGDKLCIDRLSYKFTSVDPGDIVIFLEGETIEGVFGSFENTLQDLNMKIHGQVRLNRYVKRVVGVPGDTIDIIDQVVYRNGVALEEPYAQGLSYKKQVGLPLQVPEGKVFVLGDNRENSNDSRWFGCVDIKSIEGRVVFKLWPLNQFKFY